MDDADIADILAYYPEYRLLKRGGQKVVFVVRDAERGEVVLKVGRSASARDIQRAEREVLLLKTLDSPYFPKNLDFEVRGDGRFVVLEEYIVGAPLSERMTLYSSPLAALGLVEDLLNGLQILWTRGIVHRDIKPDNILISEAGQPKIIDLGIARVLGAESITQTAAWFGPGTPNYAPREQRLNRKAEIDWRADQFGLGIVTAQLLLGGGHPFDPRLVGSGDSIPDNILRGKWHRGAFDLAPLRTFRRLLTRLLGSEPYQRYKTVAALSADLAFCREAIA
jgi:serine/threonine protein kinase